MPRPLRVQFAGAVYHLMNRGVRGEDLYTDAREHRHFLALLAEACVRYDLPPKNVAQLRHEVAVLKAKVRKLTARNKKPTDGGTTWSASSTDVSSVSSDPAASAQNGLTRQFWGDYNTLVSTNANAFFIYTDSRHGVGCPAVDAFQHGTGATPAPGTDLRGAVR